MSETKNLKLFKHNEPLETNENKFDIDLALNQNWDKIEEFADMVNDKIIEIEDKDEEQDFNLQELQNEIKKDRDNMINLEVEGQSIHIEDSSDLEGQLEVLGNVEQDVREGYNLYDYMSKAISTTKGLTVTKDTENGYLIVNGTPEVSYLSVCNSMEITDILKDKATYTLWQEKYDNKLYLQVVETKKDGTGNTYFFSASQKTAFTVDKSKYSRYAINIQIGLTTQAGTFNNYKNRYMLYEGTEEKTYEPYGASPSPEYPSEIRAVGDKGSVGIKKTTANYYNVKSYVGSQPPPVDENDWITITGNNTGTSPKYLNYFTRNLDVIVGEKYWIVAEIKNVLGKGTFNITSQFFNQGQFNQGQFKGYSKQIQDIKAGDVFIYQSTAVKTKGDEQGLRTFIELRPDESANITFRLSVLETEPNKSNWKYVPYKKETKILPIQKPMLEGDYFIKEVDGWKEVHKWEKRIFNGTERFGNIENTGSVKYFSCYEVLNTYKYLGDNTANYISNCFKSIPVSQRYQNNTFFINSGKNPIFSSNSFSTTEEFKAKLVELYNANNPMYIYYELATPTKLPCTPEQTKILDELDNFTTYKPVTNIKTDSIAKLKLKYIADTKTYIDNKTSNLEQQVNTINQLLSTTKTSSVLLDNLQSDIEREVL